MHVDIMQNWDMPYMLNWEDRGVVAKFWGTTNSAEALEMLNAVGDDHRFDSLAWRINDFLDVEVHDARPSEVKYIDALNHVLPLTNARIVTAIAVKREDIAALVRELVAKHPYPDNVAMFDNMQDARAWIETKTPFLVRPAPRV